MLSLLIVLLSLVFAASAFGQSPQAAISGVIKDPQGAAVPGVEVMATELATGVKTAVRSNESGFYSLRPLPIGSYRVTADLTGFRRHVREGIVLTTGQSLELNIGLEVGAVAESVTVSARASLLETRNSDASQLVESQSIEDMPLGDRRAMNLIEITGAAVFVDYDDGSKPNFSLAGGRTQSQGFMIDGGTAQNMRIGIGQIDTDPPVESLQEVKIMANGFSAEYGGSAGGVIVANTKSGTNQIKGSLFEYLRNQKLDAPNFFSPIVDGKKQNPALRYNVFGGTVGGPVRRDKTFYFFSYEGSRRRNGSIRTLTVPSDLQKTGDFTETYNGRGVQVKIYDPASSRSESGSVIRDPFPGNRIPDSRMDPVTVKLMPFYPKANRPPDDLAGANNFRANDVTALTRDNYILKIDHNLNGYNKITARYLYNSDNTTGVSVFPNRAADTAGDTLRHQQYWYGTWTRIFTPALLHEFRITYGRRINHQLSRGFGGNWPSKLGIKGVPDDAFPQINAAGFTDLGAGTQERKQFPIQQYQLVSNASWILRRHAIKFGGEIRPSMNYEIFRPTISGSFTFSRGFSGLPGNANTGSGLATLLLGTPTNFAQRETPVLDRVSWYLAGFVQDDWTVRDGLTLNLGVRWEVDTPIRDRDNRLNGFDTTAINPVSGTPGVVKFAGVNGFRSRIFDPDWNNFGPRFGFAWRPAGIGRTVVRGGFGVFFAHPFDRAVANVATLGFERSSALVLLDNNLGMPYTVGGGLPIPPLSQPVLSDSFGAVPAGQTSTQAVTFFETNRRTGYSQQFNLQIQRELPGGLLAEVGYLGNLSRKLSSDNISINQIPPDVLGPGRTGRQYRPYPQFSNVSILAPSFGVSSYHAGLLKVQKRFSRGFNVLATYTWSKFLDNSSGGGATLGGEGAAYSNFYNRRADWGPSENDIRHRFTLGSVYQLPFGKRRKYLRRNPARYVAGDWSLSTVTTIQTGAPITVQTQTNSTNANSAGAQRADVLRDPNLPPGQRTIMRWFDTTAFAQPPQYTFGNQGMGLVRADGRININCSLIRSFPVGEKKQLQFRGEFFNLPNHPNFGNPAHQFEGAGFGIVNSARPARQVQVGLRLTY
ncbi:MAG: carboxypeptidase regulatory-like domain-containing protein [Acidobacteria bacterium]|nr:carboxypeptidase regulatory-like domain-containing protein [Acidobacteriota bacterium]